jgi:RimJ/RimL family protein N-acetyltransferase
VDYTQFVKRLNAESEVPRTLTYEDVEIRAIHRDQVADDVKGINASLDLIRQTRGGNWPTGPVTEEYNYVDLVWHEAEFRDGGSYTYTIWDATNRYLGCVYLYPMGGRTKLTEALLDHDVDVSWWVTPPAYEEGYYKKLHQALLHWLANDLPFKNPYISNKEIPTV